MAIVRASPFEWPVFCIWMPARSGGVMENAVHTAACIWPARLITHLIESRWVFVWSLRVLQLFCTKQKGDVHLSDLPFGPYLAVRGSHED